MFSCDLTHIHCFYEQVITTYEKDYLTAFSYKKFYISKYEIVYCIEDSFILYACIEHTTNQFSDNLYHVKLEELLPNNIFKFIINKFLEKFADSFYLIFYKRFCGLQNCMQQALINSTTADTINYVNGKLPKLKIIDRIKKWKGFPHTLVYFKIDSGESQTYGNCITQHDKGYITAYQKCKDLDAKCLYTFFPERNFFYCGGFLFDKNVNATLKQIKYQKPYMLYQKIYFWFERQYLIDICDIKEKQIDYLTNFFYTELYYTTPFIYDKKPVKWKSEYMAYELTQKIYGSENVIFQYRPYFLNYNGHQLTYDIYIPRQKIAIEYQGKQHFEPVAYFGGQEAFNNQRQRDLLKKELSESNGIKLVTLNYWEDLTIDNIKQKIKLYEYR